MDGATRRNTKSVMFKGQLLIPDGSTYDPVLSEVNLRLLANNGDVDLSLEHMRERGEQFPSTEPTMKKAIDWLKENREHVSIAGPTYNYVIFHPDFIKALAQYDIKGDKIKDYGPGVHLKSVEHDPFKGE
jgi:hypothetical protein